MRLMSFALTTRQVREQSKTVTRRLGSSYRAGEQRQPIVKGMGLKKGEHVEKVGGPILLIDVRREPLEAITQADVIAEGFPELTPAEFVAMFRKHAGRNVDQVTRIEYRYL